MADPIDIANDIAERSIQNLISNHVNREQGESAESCKECGNSIPEGRRKACSGTQHCIECAEYFERKF